MVPMCVGHRYLSLRLFMYLSKLIHLSQSAVWNSHVVENFSIFQKIRTVSPRITTLPISDDLWLRRNLHLSCFELYHLPRAIRRKRPGWVTHNAVE